MAFIRSYSQQGARFLMDQGDPFSLRIPKKLRKWQPGKSLKKLAQIVAPVASFIPGVGGILARLAPIAQKYSVPLETLQGFARMYGYDVGDPGPAKKRKSAGSGTKAKSKAKKERRAEKASKPKGKGKRPSGSKQPIDWGAIGEAATSLLPVGADLAKELGRQFGGGAAAGAVPPGLEEELAAALGGKKPRGGTLRLPGMGGGRRTMNPANVKALRRSMRRVEGFQKLVKRVNKMFPKIARGYSSSSSAPGPRRARGHRASCGCAVCRRAA